MMTSVSRLVLWGALSALVSGPALAQDLTFELINASGYDLVQFYTSPVDVGDWEEDVFGTGVLPSGNSVEVTIADGRTQCSYDLRFVFDDGDVIEDSADLCEMGSYTIE